MGHKVILTFIAILVLVNLSCSKSVNVEDVKTNFSDAPKSFSERTFDLYIPSMLNNDSVPLIFVFHGAFGNGKSMFGVGFNQYADSNNFIICYPDAFVENWEEGCECNKPHRLGIDDIGFVDFLIDSLSTIYNIDGKRIYGVGFSQGGLFVQNVACKLSNRFAAIASVASPMSVNLYQKCDPSDNIAMLMIHGANDFVLPFDGLDDGSFSLVSSISAIKLWGNLNNCSPFEKYEVLRDKGDPNISVIKRYYENCENNVQTILYEIVGGGHNWPRSSDIDATKEIINFLLLHHK